MVFVRKSNRLPIHNLYQGGQWYFITICTTNRQCLFVEEGLSLQNGLFHLTRYGIVVEQTLLCLADVFTNIFVDEYIIMPNHLHIIISLGDKQVKKETGKQANLSDIIGYLKAYSQKIIREIDYGINNGGINPPLHKDLNIHKVWQKSFYDHVIRDEKNLNKIREYIRNNPLQWELDEYNPKHKVVLN
jgi:putative transposase